jgi:L-alanine-DL-glutamate epimerase-like enolase superfamily enzyme
MVLKRGRKMRSIARTAGRLGSGEGFVVESIAARPLSVPLIDPFVIASGRVDATRAVEVEVLVAWRGRRAIGLGEAACLPPVTREDQGDVLRALASLPGAGFEGTTDDVSAAIASLGPVARAGVETAVLDALARIADVPVRELLLDGGAPGVSASTLETDVTIAIADAERMAWLARDWFARGFRALKVKVGKDVDADVKALVAIATAAPGARLRVDANAGYSAREAIALASECMRRGVPVECWEQPCAEADLEGMAEVAAALDAPVIADESVKGLADVQRIVDGRCADGVNLKLAKSGGPLAALAIGRAARAAGLKVMIGGMVETRLGMTAAAHVACSLGGVDFVDLDTAWLLADDPYEGGYVADGPRYTMPDTPGLGLRRRPRQESNL